MHCYQEVQINKLLCGCTCESAAGVVLIISGIWWSRSISLIGSILPLQDTCWACGLAIHILNSPRQVTSERWEWREG